jgi:hypothetical protein
VNGFQHFVAKKLKTKAVHLLSGILTSRIWTSAYVLPIPQELILFRSIYNIGGIGRQPIALLTWVSFDSCYMFQSAYGTVFRQAHEIHLLLLNCT